jgi:hypothetical protein
MRPSGIVLAALALCIGSAADAETFGKQEHVQVLGGSSSSIEVTATMSGGGQRTMLYAREIKYFFRDGGTWVRFTIDNGSVVTGKHLTLEKPLIKDERIRQKDGGIEHISRVQGELCIGRHRIATELRVSDRSAYTAPLVIGSDDLAPLGSVDPAKNFLHEPDCAPVPAAPAPAAPPQ